MDVFLGKVYVSFEWFVRIVYLQLLFLLFTVIGLVVFGLFPALAALMAIIRQWLKGATDQNGFKVFLSYFRQYFIKGNLLGLSLSFVTASLLIYIYWFWQIDHLIANLLLYVIFFILFFILIIWLYWLPVLIHYELKGYQYFKYALLIGLLRPLHTILLILLCIFIYYLSRFIPGLLPIASISLLASGWISIALKSFEKFDQRIDSLLK